MTVLRVEDMSIVYATREGTVPAVRGVSFEIERGQVLALRPEGQVGPGQLGAHVGREGGEPDRVAVAIRDS